MVYITFLAGQDKKEVKARKVILASRSPVFLSMFYGPLAESKQTIEIPDIEADIFRSLIRFINTEDCDINPSTVMALLYAAEKYDIARLATRCTNYLEKEICIENVCLILQHAYQFVKNDLMQKCMDYIFVNGTEIFKSEGIQLLCKEMLQKIIQSDKLDVSEVDVYEACKRWASANLRQKDKTDVSGDEIREELGDLIFSIRFPRMDPNYFVMHVSNEQILTAKEKLLIFQSFQEEAPHQNSLSCFNGKPRKYMIVSFQDIIARFDTSDIITAWSNRSQWYGITFQVSKPVHMYGVSMFTPCERGMIHGRLGLLEADNVLSECHVEVKYEVGSFTKPCLFRHPVILKASTLYTLRQKITGVPSYRGKNGKKKCVHDKLGVKVQFFNVEDNRYESATSTVSGQFHGLILKKR